MTFTPKPSPSQQLTPAELESLRQEKSRAEFRTAIFRAQQGDNAVRQQIEDAWAPLRDALLLDLYGVITTATPGETS